MLRNDGHSRRVVRKCPGDHRWREVGGERRGDMRRHDERQAAHTRSETRTVIWRVLAAMALILNRRTIPVTSAAMVAEPIPSTA